MTGSCLFANVLIKLFRMHMLVDIGAAVSLISKEVLDNLDLCDFLQKVSTELKTADGEPLQVYGQTEMTFGDLLITSRLIRR